MQQLSGFPWRAETKKKKKKNQEGYSPQQGLQQSVPKGTSTPTDHIKWAYIFTILLNEAMYITTACSTHLHRFTSRLSSTSTAVSSRSGPGGPGDREKNPRCCNTNPSQTH